MYNSIKKKIIILNILLILYAVIHQVFIFDKLLKYCDLIGSAFILIMTSISIFLLGFRRDTKTNSKINIFYRSLAVIMFYFVITYLLGFLVGFNKNAYSIKPIMIFKNTFAPIVLYLCIEIYRYVNINSINKKNNLNKLITFALILFEILVTIRFSKIHSSLGIFKIVTINIIPIIITNIAMSNLCRYSGIRTTIVYRLIMNIYIYVVPILPNFSDYVNSMLGIVLPIILYKYVLHDNIEEKNKIDKFDKLDDKIDISNILITGSIICFIMLLSGIFPIRIVGVASGSMSPKIDKGDAIIYKTVTSDKDIEVGDILVFKSGNKTIIHRLMEKKEEDNTIYYITKGDANNTEDSFKTTIKDIEGKVSFKIKYIAYPSIYLNNLLKG